MYAKYVVLENLPRLNCLPFTAAVSCVRVTKLQYHNIGSLVAKLYLPLGLSKFYQPI